MGLQHMQIGEVAERTGLSLRTIRYYEEMDLVVPSARTSGGFRLYTATDVARLLLIKRMKPLHFSLEEMGELLEARDRLEAGADGAEREALVARLEGFHEAARSRVAAIRTQLATAEEFAEDLSTELDRQRGAVRGNP
jgi:DNA-binding transcriptional MerR regulator